MDFPTTAINQTFSAGSAPVTEQVTEVLSQAESALGLARERLQNMAFGPQAEAPSSTAVAYQTTISGQAMDIRTLAREVDALTETVMNRLGTPV